MKFPMHCVLTENKHKPMDKPDKYWIHGVVSYFLRHHMKRNQRLSLERFFLSVNALQGYPYLVSLAKQKRTSTLILNIYYFRETSLGRFMPIPSDIDTLVKKL